MTKLNKQPSWLDQLCRKFPLPWQSGEEHEIKKKIDSLFIWTMNIDIDFVSNDLDQN